MARLAILASGGGSNFEALTLALKNTEHEVACLICDRKNAKVFERAKRLGIKSYYVTYYKQDKLKSEEQITSILNNESVDLVALAGFMRLLSAKFVNNWHNKIVNIHPTLLPKYPGSNGILDSYNSGDKELGVTIHYVDSGMDTGTIIHQDSFIREENEPLESIENKIHAIEHKIYPEIILKLFRRIN